MMPLINKDTEVLQECDPSIFRGMFVEQVIRARDSIFEQMREGLNVGNNEEIRACYMAKKTVTRDNLISWLETVSCILNSFAVPLLESAAEMSENFQTLKDEKIKDQESIIKMQEKLIEKKDTEISAVHSTIQSSVQSTMKEEMKSYSSVVTKTCGAVLAPKKIQAAVRKATDKNERVKNVIIYGLQEVNGENLGQRVEEVLTEIEEKPRVQDCCRIGSTKTDHCRPIKFTLSSPEQVNQVLRKSKLLRAKEGFKSVYICPDRSNEERKAFKTLLEQLKQKRLVEPGKVHFIKNNKITSVT